MKIVIDIPESFYRALKADEDIFRRPQPYLPVCAILDGTPLPKGHGRLIDVSTIHKEAHYAEEDSVTGAGMCYSEMEFFNEGVDEMYSAIERAPTIVEADKGDTNADSN